MPQLFRIGKLDMSRHPNRVCKFEDPPKWPYIDVSHFFTKHVTPLKFLFSLAFPLPPQPRGGDKHHWDPPCHHVLPNSFIQTSKKTHTWYGFCIFRNGSFRPNFGSSKNHPIRLPADPKVLLGSCKLR